MNLVVLHSNCPHYNSIVEYSSVIYDYAISPTWHCIEVDDESLCALTMAYMVSRFVYNLPTDMPTYILNTYP